MSAASPAGEHEALFAQHRRRTFAVAYRLLGSVSDAEDVLQDAWLRWSGTPLAGIASPEAWLAVTASRLAIDRLRAAKARREAYVGPWLPEPIVDTGHPPEPTPEEAVALADDVSMALLHVLERLAPEERAAFLLHDAFDLDHSELATLLGKSEAACRQLVSRARVRVRAERPRVAANHAEHARLASAFHRAILTADPQALIACLAENAVLYSDGGGKVAAALNPIVGADRIQRFLFGLANKKRVSFQTRPVEINGLPGYLLMQDGALDSALSFDVADGRIQEIYIVRNPEKLRHLPAFPGER